MLTGASGPFNAMFSERWATNDGPIPIKNYSFEEFKEFLSFIYFFDCQLSEENIIAMVDMAEYYQVPECTEFCDDFLSTEIEITLENGLKMFEFAKRYPSLTKFQIVIDRFMMEEYVDVLESDELLNIGKATFQAVIDLPQANVLQEKIFVTVSFTLYIYIYS